MQFLEIIYQTEKQIYVSGRIKKQVVKLGFWYAETPKEISLEDYQKAILATQKMPLFCKVILGFKFAKDVPAVERTDNFNFNRCTAAEKQQVYASIKNILLPLLKKKKLPLGAADTLGKQKPTIERFEPVSEKDLSFMLDANVMEFLPVDDLMDLVRVMLYNISDAFILQKTEGLSYEEAQEVLEGENVIHLSYTDKQTKLVTNRIFYLPFEEVKSFYDKIIVDVIKANAGKSENDQKTEAQLKREKLSKTIHTNSFPDYITWDATTALFFNDMLGEKKVSESKALAALLAALCVEIETLEPLIEKQILPRATEEIRKETELLIELFEKKLTMDWVHKIKFFFSHTYQLYKTHTL